MEIQHGKGPWADPVAGIVPLGTTLTMVVGINDKLGEYSHDLVAGVQIGANIGLHAAGAVPSNDHLSEPSNGRIPLHPQNVRRMMRKIVSCLPLSLQKTSACMIM